METKEAKKMKFAVAMAESYKTSKNPWVSPKFTKVEINENAECVVTRDLYQLYEKAAIEISKKHKIFSEKFSKTNGPSYSESITDDDTIADWLDQYDGNLSQLQLDYPNITISEIVDLFTWYTLCQQRACTPASTNFLQITTHK
jgi:hypothetical protein